MRESEELHMRTGVRCARAIRQLGQILIYRTISSQTRERRKKAEIAAPTADNGTVWDCQKLQDKLIGISRTVKDGPSSGLK